MPCVEQTQNGVSPAARSSAIISASALGPHRERLVVRHDAEPIGADAGDAQPLLDAASAPATLHMQRGRDVSPSRLTAPSVIAPPCGEDRRQRRLAGRAVDHPAARLRSSSGTRSGSPSSSCIQSSISVSTSVHAGLGDPAHALHAEPGGEQLAEDRRVATSWPGSRRRSSGAASGCSPGTTTRSSVGHHRVEAVRRGRRVLGELGAHVARPRPSTSPAAARCSRRSRRSSRSARGRACLKSSGVTRPPYRSAVRWPACSPGPGLARRGRSASR